LYFIIQRQMLEPAALRSGAAHGLKLEQLCRSFLLANETPLHWPMFQAELRQMEQLDIPFFEHPIDGEDLPLSHGLAPIAGYFRSSGLAAANHRIANLDATEIAFQLQLIRGAIAARHIRSASVAEAPSAHPEAIGEGAGPAQESADVYREQAHLLGEELWSAAIRDHKGRPEWLGMDLGADGESFHFGLIGTALYSGSGGIAFTFARLALDRQQAGDTAGSNRWLQRASACFEAIVAIAQHNDQDQLFRLVRDLPYGLAGSGGILLALQLLQRAGLAEAQELAGRWIGQLRPERLLADEGIDVIAGVAGLIGPLLLAGSPRAQELAVLCGDRLLALQLENGGWPQAPGSSSGKPPLTGFSHGAAGMAAALARARASKGVAVGAQREQIKRWFWCSVFSQAYESSPNTQSSRDVGELIPWLSDSAAPAPENVRGFHFNPELLRDVTPRQRSLYRATICLILASGDRPLDFHSRAVLNDQLLASSGNDDHHIFPAKFLEDRGLDTRQRDCVLNRCLIDTITNQRISCSAPSTYMAELRDEPGFPMQAVLSSHLIPHGPESGLWSDDFERFLEQRLELVGAAIAQVAGASPSASTPHEKPALVH
jgi:hypothetical protein